MQPNPRNTGRSCQPVHSNPTYIYIQITTTTREPQNISNIVSSSLYYSSESRMTHVLFTIVVFFGYSGVQRVLCCIFALFVFIWCTPCYQFLWIVHLWFPLQYSITFICLIVVLVEITNYSIAIPECVFSISKLKYLVLYAFFITFTCIVFRKYSSPDQQE